MTTDKVRENAVRRAAERQGLTLSRSRRRDPRSLGYGTYGLRDAETGTFVLADERTGYGFTLDQIEAYLDGERP
ncbi:hypothetical protein [Microbacterium sp.]|uniref:hypothetical protein n=1 Tax=Microbacterium sp. TaxID=51671 RepID=UPI003C753B79